MEVNKTNLKNNIGHPNPTVKENTKQIKEVTSKVNDIEDKKEYKVDQKEVKSAIDKANKILFKNNTHLKFEIHDKTKDVMVKIINDENGEVLKEIPSQKMLDMVAKLWEIAGIFVDENFIANTTFNEPIPGSTNIPYSYLKRYYKEIPKRKLLIMATDSLEKNLAIRFLLKKKFHVSGFKIINNRGGNQWNITSKQKIV
jgi:flagellar protein FlaG